MIWLLAHAAPINYKFPLPIWLYVVAGGVAVLVSAPAAALGVRTAPPRERRGRDLHPVARALRLGPIVTALVGLLLVYGIVFGLAASNEQAHEFFENPMTMLTRVDFWVGLGLLATFVGNVWDRISPLDVATGALDRALARRGIPQRAYPTPLGRWPAVVLVVVWSWMELVWDQAKDPVWLAPIVLGYCVACLVGAARHGAEPWLDNAELLTVREDEARLRPFGAGLRKEPPMAAGAGAFVLALLATVIYDGFSQTSRFTQLADKMIAGWSWLGVHTDVLRTIVLVGVVVLFVGLYIGVCALMSERRNALATAARYAPTLVPIAPVYFIAHYFTYAWTQVVLIVRVALGRRLAPQRTLAFQAPLEVKVA